MQDDVETGRAGGARASFAPPVDTRRLAQAAAMCARGRDDLAGRGHAPGEGPTLRRFSFWEVHRYLIPCEAAALRAFLRARPDLPQGARADGEGLSFTLEEAFELRAAWRAEHDPAAPPLRPDGARAKIVAVANFKGGVGKTSTALHLAMAAALDGARVLAIDLDSQGSLTSMFGVRIEDEWGTAFPLIAGDYAMALEAENVARAARGEAARAMDETLAEARAVTPDALIRATRWPTIDLIGAQLNLYWAEFQIPVWRMASPGWPLWDALGAQLERGDLLDRYDLVLIDTPPALGYLTINALAAADIVLAPLGASFLEFDSTGRFFDMLHATFASIEESENRAARADGRPELRFEWDAVRALLTRYDAAQQSELAALIEAYLGDLAATRRQPYTALAGQAAEQAVGIYEADPRDFNRDTYIRGRAAFDETYAEFRALLVDAWARDAAETEEAAHG